jgi:NADH:ubiquinone oxidoreductase subunit E
MTEQKVEVFVCVNVGCRSRGARPMLERLKQVLSERGLSQIVPAEIICFAACNLGPNVVIPARRCWLSGVTVGDVEAIADYLEGEADAGDLQRNNDPVIERMIFEMIDAGLLNRAPST